MPTTATATAPTILKVDQTLNDTVIDLPPRFQALHEHRTHVVATIAALKAEQEAIDVEFKLAMEAAGTGRLPDGSYYTYKETLVNGFTVQPRKQRSLLRVKP